MYRDNANTNVNPKKPSPQALYRGLYVRIARKLGVDASYVSRVARGDRRSDEVESALRLALDQIEQQLGRAASCADSGRPRPANAAKRLKILVQQNRGRIRQQWLTHSQADPNLNRVNTGLPDKAGALFGEVTKISTSSETYYNYACFLAAQQRNVEARVWAQRILDKKPTMPGYLRRRERPWFRKAAALLKRLPV